MIPTTIARTFSHSCSTRARYRTPASQQGHPRLGRTLRFMSAIVPDDKDWTWTLERACPDCGFEASTVVAELLPGSVEVLTSPWAQVLTRPDVRERPEPATWSPLEYAAHVRDVCRLFADRTRLMLDEDSPTFTNWDQDLTAIEDDYAGQDPATVATEVAEAAQSYAAVLASVEGAAWECTGVRSNGSRFTVLTLSQYGLHDLAHHLWDVRSDPS